MFWWDLPDVSLELPLVKVNYACGERIIGLNLCRVLLSVVGR